MRDDIVIIKSRDYWFKVVEFLQQNWALIDSNSDGSCSVYFIHDASGVFDQMNFHSESEAESGLSRNGFTRFSEDTNSQKFIGPPNPPFFRGQHPNGPIYSSGKFWG